MRRAGLLGAAWLLVFAALLAAPARAADRAPLRWGTDLQGGAPYTFVDPHHPDRVIGFEQELAEALAGKLHRPLCRVQVEWESLIPALDRGTIDVAMNAIEVTPEHERAARFTHPYYVYRQQLVVRGDERRIHGVRDLQGMRVGTVPASAAERMLQRQGGIRLVRYADMVAPFRDLGLGRLDAVFLDRPIALYYAPSQPGLRFVMPPVGEGLYAAAVRKGDAALERDLDGAIAAVQADGTLERILRRWNLWDGEQAKLAGLAARTARDGDAHRPGPGVSGAGAWLSALPVLLAGAGVTVVLTVLSMALAVALGLPLAALRLHGPPPARWLATAYVEVFRGTPLLVQLYLLYYGLPVLGVKLDALVAGVLGLGLNYAANEAENFRGGIQAVPKGQVEAAEALGLSAFQVLKDVVLPQAVRIAIPPVTNDFIALFKDSSLVSVITLVELTKAYGMLASATYDYLGLGLLTAALYFGLSYPTSRLVRWVEVKVRIS